MSLMKALDEFIHSIPFFPDKLQGTWLDKLWEKIESNSKENKV